MRELIRDIYPEGHTAQFRQRTDFGHNYIEPAGVYDVDGERIYEDITFQDGKVMGERAGVRDLERELRTIGRMFSEEREAAAMQDFTTSKGADSNTYYTLSLTRE